jgi:hypothetical protein
MKPPAFKAALPLGRRETATKANDLIVRPQRE